jgi:hypothetical protein
VRWYLRFGLSYPGVEELLAERGIEVDHASVYRWVQRFTPLLAQGPAKSRFARFVPLAALAQISGGRQLAVASHERAWRPTRTFRYLAGRCGTPRSRRTFGRRRLRRQPDSHCLAATGASSLLVAKSR